MTYSDVIVVRQMKWFIAKTIVTIVNASRINMITFNTWLLSYLVLSGLANDYQIYRLECKMNDAEKEIKELKEKSAPVKTIAREKNELNNVRS